ncbi:hypothetical protein PCASD_26397 [Puccinia coronata f. sp. avenae]|uniref:Uncharacterized protein n=1 Tax=Puccinia coronata f. sp. avenae TaxID=200324 RepID=A0A2N5RWZ5_9BASI|nr:hypothetical protein PCASD_26397 [Puccinia coronata f. sp. avenae]
MCIQNKSPKRGVFPNGAYHNSKTINDNFFTRESKNARDTKLIEEDMPFLYKLISSKLLNSIQPKTHGYSDKNVIAKTPTPLTQTIELKMMTLKAKMLQLQPRLYAQWCCLEKTAGPTQRSFGARFYSWPAALRNKSTATFITLGLQFLKKLDFQL